MERQWGFVVVITDTFAEEIRLRRDTMYKDYDVFIENAGILEDSNKSLDDIQKEIATLFENEEDMELKKLSIWDRELFICCEISLERRATIFISSKCFYKRKVYTRYR